MYGLRLMLAASPAHTSRAVRVVCLPFYDRSAA